MSGGKDSWNALSDACQGWRGSLSLVLLGGREGRGTCNGEEFTAFWAAVGVSKIARMMLLVGWWVGFVVSYFFVLVNFVRSDDCRC